MHKANENIHTLAKVLHSKTSEALGMQKNGLHIKVGQKQQVIRQCSQDDFQLKILYYQLNVRHFET